MVKIAPSIFSADFANLERDIKKVQGADYLHVDVLDGVFVPNIAVGLPVVKSIRQVTEMILDVHLMVIQPVRYAAQFCDAGADIVSFHVEADTIDNIKRAIEIVRAKGKRAGIAIKPRTPTEAILPFLEDVSLVLVMTVEPGFGGQRFIAEMLPRIKVLRRYINELGAPCDLEVDGGIDLETAPLCITAGADVLVSGSTVFGAHDIDACIAELRS